MDYGRSRDGSPQPGKGYLGRRPLEGRLWGGIPGKKPSKMENPGRLGKSQQARRLSKGKGGANPGRWKTPQRGHAIIPKKARTFEDALFKGGPFMAGRKTNGGLFHPGSLKKRLPYIRGPSLKGIKDTRGPFNKKGGENHTTHRGGGGHQITFRRASPKARRTLSITPRAGAKKRQPGREQTCPPSQK